MIWRAIGGARYRSSVCSSAKMRAWVAKRDGPKIERWIVRVAIAALFAAIIWFALAFVIPPHATGGNRMPSVALGQPDLYRAEVCLALVYAGLLLLTPLFYGLVRGTLPIEISHQGAKWPKAAACVRIAAP